MKKCMLSILLLSSLLLGAASLPPRSNPMQAPGKVLGLGSCRDATIMVIGLKWEGENWVMLIDPETVRFVVVNEQETVVVAGVGKEPVLQEFEPGQFQKMYATPCDWLLMKEATL